MITLVTGILKVVTLYWFIAAKVQKGWHVDTLKCTYLCRLNKDKKLQRGMD